MLRWSLKWGEQASFLLDNQAEDGEPVQALEDEPTLAPDVALLFECYMLLARSRAPGFSGVPSINLRDTEACYRVYELEGSLPIIEFVHLMMELDSITIAAYKEKHPT